MLVMTLICFIILMFIPHEGLANSNEVKPLIILTENKLEYSMVKKIVKDKHNVQYMFKNEEEIINYNEENNIDCDLFFYSNNFNKEVISKIKNDIDTNTTGVVDITRGIGNSCECFWTNLDEYLICLYNIKSAISDKDPKNKDFYEENYKKAVKEIKNKIKNVKEKISDYKDYVFISIDNYSDVINKIFDLDVVKCDMLDIEKYIYDNSISRDKVVILKHKDTEYSSEDIKTINIEGNKGDYLLSELIEINYNQLERIIEKRN